MKNKLLILMPVLLLVSIATVSAGDFILRNNTNDQLFRVDTAGNGNFTGTIREEGVLLSDIYLALGANATITNLNVTGFFNASGTVDFAIDSIAEGDIAFATVCAAGNHLYVNGNDLACEANVGNCSAANSCVDIIYETELDDLAELNAQIADAHLTATGTLTDTKYCLYDAANDYINCTADTTVTKEQVQDFAWAVLNGTQTHITVTYDDANNNVTFVVSDDWWDATADIDDYELNDSKINFTIDCAAGNHLYVAAGNVLGCEADDNTGNCSVANSCADIIYETELDDLAELNAQIADAHLTATGTLTDTKFCVYDAGNDFINCTETAAGNTTEEMQDVTIGVLVGDEGITYVYDDVSNTGNISFDCSEVTDSGSDHLGCSDENLVVDDDFLLNTGDTLSGGNLNISNGDLILDNSANITGGGGTKLTIDATGNLVITLIV